ncbi:type I 3-dehydroquinate dehydratase [Gluconacetobacter tumulisoli]|uniref:3-dehydroquinate dehydratase n=1 Tax=Gluconacetobacter tumulisoli TaxID=1286189 RepID=A0A7W4K700_9PROT|nr:type I 3-dehydroquinate dehydratase [Gluconacetobacter tumulisoli]MBB2201516.1 type I 3-dehydroquinate dehydratase [Gluconacetobacter tumulisoli]
MQSNTARGATLRGVKVRGVTLGVGRPAIIVPIIAATAAEARAAAHRLATEDAIDLVELRVDYLHCVLDGPRTAALCREVRHVLARHPLIVTFRTGAEGGMTPIGDEAYVAFYDHVLNAAGPDPLPDLVDVEFNRGRHVVRRIVTAARGAGVGVILSSHDFAGTDSAPALVDRMRAMQDFDVDIVKLAVMPRDGGDVLNLLAATYEMRTRWADRPLITMAMGGVGVVSRLAGEVFGSAATFGTLGQPSAPGQIDAHDLRHCVDIVHGAAAPDLRVAGTPPHGAIP